MSYRPLILAAVAAVLGSPVATIAQEVGDVVELKTATDLRVSKEVGDKVPGGAKLVVKAKNGKWLWVEYNKPGWIKETDVTVVKDGAADLARLSAEKQTAVKGLWKKGARIIFSAEGDVEGLDLSMREVSADDLAHLEPLDNLKHVMLIWCGVRDDDLTHFKGHQKLEALFLGANKFSGSGLANISHATTLRGLYLMLTPVNDEGLAHLAKLENLEELRLTQTLVTNKGMPHLAGLKKLRSLELGGTAVGPEGVKQLASLTNLVVLDLSSTRVDDASLAELKTLEKLAGLRLYDCKGVSNAGLVHLSGLKLQELDVKGNRQITDEALPTLGKLTTLTRLNLASTRVSDAGLVHLYGLSDLQELEIGGSAVTRKGIASLKKALPKAKVVE